MPESASPRCVICTQLFLALTYPPPRARQQSLLHTLSCSSLLSLSLPPRLSRSVCISYTYTFTTGSPGQVWSRNSTVIVQQRGREWNDVRQRNSNWAWRDCERECEGQIIVKEFKRKKSHVHVHVTHARNALTYPTCSHSFSFWHTFI